jgi:hypothetical protein
LSFFHDFRVFIRTVQVLAKELHAMTQGLTDLTAAAAALTASNNTLNATIASAIPLIGGTPDGALAPITAALSDAAASQAASNAALQSAVDAASAPTP